MKRTFIIAACAALLFACNSEKQEDAKTPENTASASTEKDKKPQQSEFADAKYVEWGKKMMAQLASGDVDGWIANYADNARFRWSSGDSLVGKDAIAKYWKDRRKGVIDSLAFSNDIWVPLKINEPQKGPDRAGVWLLSWYQVNVKYTTGKKLQFWVHVDHHFDANDKIDETIQYIDRAPIVEALGHK